MSLRVTSLLRFGRGSGEEEIFFTCQNRPVEIATVCMYVGIEYVCMISHTLRKYHITYVRTCIIVATYTVPAYTTVSTVVEF
jgi:hypothetical protein